MYYQNLNEKPGNRLGSGIRYGRCWIGPFEICWRVFQEPGFRLSLDLGEDERAVTIGIGLFLFSLWVSWSNYKVERWLREHTKRNGVKYGSGREIEVYWFEGGLWWTLWGDPYESRQKDPWYVKMHHWNARDILLGRSKYSSRLLDEHRVVIPMPEGGYPATVKINLDIWRRPRWPFPRAMVRSEIIPDKPIPFPGKGENSWDCGEDALYSSYGPYDTPLKAAMAATETVMRDRLRYGSGWNYRPEVKT